MQPLTELYLSYGLQYADIKLNIILPKITGFLSMAGSVFVIQDVLRNPQKRTKSTYHRIMLGLSVMDIIFSFSLYFLTSWPMPSGFYMYAAGTVATCDAAGFFGQIGTVGVPLYNCALTTYFSVQLKYNWVDRRIKAFEKWFHFVPIFVSVALAIVGLAARAYGPISSMCWVALQPYPIGCDSADSSTECIRGAPNNFFQYASYLTGLINFFAIFYVSITMYMVYKYVVGLERQVERYSIASFRGRGAQQPDREKSRRIMIQGILYSSALILMLLFPSISFFYGLATGGEQSLTINTLIGIFNPLQGGFNALIYLFPVFKRKFDRYQQRRRERRRNEETIRGRENITLRGGAQNSMSLPSLLISSSPGSSPSLNQELCKNSSMDQEEQKEEIIPIKNNCHEQQTSQSVRFSNSGDERSQSCSGDDSCKV